LPFAGDFEDAEVGLFWFVGGLAFEDVGGTGESVVSAPPCSDYRRIAGYRYRYAKLDAPPTVGGIQLSRLGPVAGPVPNLHIG